LFSKLILFKFLEKPLGVNKEPIFYFNKHEIKFHDKNRKKLSLILSLSLSLPNFSLTLTLSPSLSFYPLFPHLSPSSLNFSLTLSFLGLISTTCLFTAFPHQDSKSAKRQSSHTCFFALLGSAHVKTVSKMLVILTLCPYLSFSSSFFSLSVLLSLSLSLSLYLSIYLSNSLSPMAPIHLFHFSFFLSLSLTFPKFHWTCSLH